MYLYVFFSLDFPFCFFPSVSLLFRLLFLLVRSFYTILIDQSIIVRVDCNLLSLSHMQSEREILQGPEREWRTYRECVEGGRGQ